MNGPLKKTELRSLERKPDNGDATGAQALMERGRFKMGGKDEDDALQRAGNVSRAGLKRDEPLREQASAEPVPGPQLDKATQTRIGDQLRSMYNELMDQPVPDRFKSLLEQLDQPRDAAAEDAMRDPEMRDPDTKRES